MHRTRSAAMVLMGLAVTAVSGCVSVEGRPAPLSVPRPGASSGAPGAGGAQPQIVQAPAKEALEAIIPTRSPEPAPLSSPEPRRSASERTGAPERASGPERPRSGPAPTPVRKEHRRERPERQRSPEPVEAPATVADLCALGESYGRWPADSPQARICARTYRN
ncbi:hypothetical protein [Streptomyces sp. MnatMP-M17]|uniref:hypothetical protein n=1 Tax=unclassified Streptomyces TaxID=2593676 RepID=UPI000B826C7E|nr:hypothetical protein [Streptomyces sp. MnatMP-M17]MYZ34542.1 hypothetical protein [Streptomyces sp. SID4917]